jgi:hypothetical protein
MIENEGQLSEPRPLYIENSYEGLKLRQMVGEVMPPAWDAVKPPTAVSFGVYKNEVLVGSIGLVFPESLTAAEVEYVSCGLDGDSSWASGALRTLSEYMFRRYDCINQLYKEVPIGSKRDKTILEEAGFKIVSSDIAKGEFWYFGLQRP